MRFRRQPTSELEALDRKIEDRENAALFLSGLGLSFMYLGYESGVPVTSVFGGILLASSFAVEGFALDARQQRSESIESFIEAVESIDS